MFDLGTVNGATELEPHAINGRQQIVGGNVASGAYFAFLWQNQSMRDLNDLIPKSSGVHLSSANAINEHGCIAATGNDSTGELHAYLLVPAELMVDANRDGQMSFTDAAVHDSDVTNEAAPYRFWVNDDQDAISGTSFSGEVVPVAIPDNSDSKIQSVRDCEDLTRLWLNVRSITSMFNAADLKLRFRFKTVKSGSPAIRLFAAAESNDGGTKYITDPAWADAQVNGPSGQAIGGPNSIVGAGAVELDSSFWEGLTDQNPNVFLLFEGVQEGKGQLVCEIWQGGQQIGEAGGLWLDIKSIKRMYQRHDLTGQWQSFAFDKAPDEEPDLIFFVHGWNTAPYDAENDAETTFKRVWWRGYHGRFAAVRWNTHWSAQFGNVPEIGQALDGYLANFNDSEHNAWLTGPTVAQLINGMAGQFSINVIAHSMGNVVMASALRAGARVNNYALLNAAVPASCYDDRPLLAQSPASGAFGTTYWDTATPDDDPDVATQQLAYRGKLNGIRGNLINFFLPNDRATTYCWEFNNNTFRPQVGFAYDRDGAAGQKLRKTLGSNPHYLTDAEEAMPYADQSWSKVAGAERRTEGAISSSVDMSADVFSLPGETKGFADDHGAEFIRDVQNVQPFYRTLLDRLVIRQNP